MLGKLDSLFTVSSVIEGAETSPDISGLIGQYADTMERINKTGQLQTKSAQGGFKKSPVVTAAENLRRDILQYSDRLCLNPKSLSTSGIQAPKPESSLVRLLHEIEESCGMEER